MELDDDMQRWAEILEESRKQCDQWKTLGDEARVAIINSYKATGEDTGEVNGVQRYRVVEYTTKKFDRVSFAKDWAALDKAFTVESKAHRVEIIPASGEEQDD